MSLFDDLKELPTYSEALFAIRMYQNKERSTQIVYLDPKRGKGMLYVNSIGIFDRNINYTELANYTREVD